MFSFLIRHAVILDGTGKEGYKADVGLKGGKIAAIEPELPGPAGGEWDAEGLVLAPGFIDIHSHTDASIFRYPFARSKLFQGVTTEVTGNCGISLFPVNGGSRSLLQEDLQMHGVSLPADGLNWIDFSQYADRLDKEGLGPNLAPLVGHGALRMAVMGADNRPPSPRELKDMADLLDSLLRQGAWGMSTGLIYPPGIFAGTEELIALARVLAEHGALYSSHIRGEASTLLRSVGEAVRIGRETGVKVEVSHLKAIGRPNWGLGKRALEIIKQARLNGIDIAADQYPYEASATTLSVLVPEWAHAGGVSELLNRLKDLSLRSRLLREIESKIDERGGPDCVQIASLGAPKNMSASGHTLSWLAGEWNTSPQQAAVRLLLEENAAVGAVYFSLSEDDLNAIMSSDIISVGSDGRGLDPEGEAGRPTHPRSYGTFPRVLGLFARDKKILPLPTAVYKMTGLPASRVGFTDRGTIKPGLAADLVLFNPETINDKADFHQPHQYPEGIKGVWVAGQSADIDGRLTGQRLGRVLRKKIV
jgi:N-acyl-D-amino-acid deacylase